MRAVKAKKLRRACLGLGQPNGLEPVPGTARVRHTDVLRMSPSGAPESVRIEYRTVTLAHPAMSNRAIYQQLKRIA